MKNHLYVHGGAEKCDRKCGVSIINIEGKKYPFGGACNKYYNLQIDKHSHKEQDLVKLRQQLVFEKYICPVELKEDAPSIGISKSFLSNTLYPLYYNFFTQLGFRVILGDQVKTSGIDKKEAAFCYPVELAHASFRIYLIKVRIMFSFRILKRYTILMKTHKRKPVCWFSLKVITFQLHLRKS